MTSLILIVGLCFCLQDCSRAQKQLSQWRNGLWFWYHECRRTAISQITGGWDQETKSMTSSVAESRLRLRIHFPYVHLSAPLLTSPRHLTLGQYLSLTQLMVSSTCLTWRYFDGMEDERQRCPLPPPGATSSLLRCKSTLIIIWTHYDHCCNFHPIETQVVWKWANNQPLRLPS